MIVEQSSDSEVKSTQKIGPDMGVTEVHCEGNGSVCDTDTGGIDNGPDTGMAEVHGEGNGSVRDIDTGDTRDKGDQSILETDAGGVQDNGRDHVTKDKGSRSAHETGTGML